ncbi:MAG: hypothetical protein ACK5LC_13700 [Coprobacillaceae bacterium]
MGIIKYKELSTIQQNKKGITLYLRFTPTIHTIQNNIHNFPIYCSCCHKTLPDFFCHMGSRYGQVGDICCDYCGKLISIIDHDNIVDEIFVNGLAIQLSKIYKTQWEYFSYIKENFTIDYRNIFRNENGIRL